MLQTRICRGVHRPTRIHFRAIGTVQTSTNPAAPAARARRYCSTGPAPAATHS